MTQATHPPPPDQEDDNEHTAEQLVTGVDFVPVPTHDLEPAVEFYGSTLGLRRSVYMPERNFAEFETGNLTLSVIDAGGDGDQHYVERERDRAARRRRRSRRARRSKRGA